MARMDDAQVGRAARQLAAVVEPLAASVYYSPECHERYEALGFNPSGGVRRGVAQPDGVAYFTSRGAQLGQVPGEVVAATFAVFNPAVVVPAVAAGWALTDAVTISAARTLGAVAQLERILGPAPEGIGRAADLLERAGDELAVAGRPLFSAVCAQPVPEGDLGRAWRMADRLREYRGDSHIASWTAAGLDAIEIGLLSELFWGVRSKSYIRSRAWSMEELDAGVDRLTQRGLVADGAFTPVGRRLREDVEDHTDAQCRPVIEALGDDLDELLGLLTPVADAIKAAGGYPEAGPHDLAREAAGTAESGA